MIIIALETARTRPTVEGEIEGLLSYMASTPQPAPCAFYVIHPDRVVAVPINDAAELALVAPIAATGVAVVVCIRSSRATIPLPDHMADAPDEEKLAYAHERVAREGLPPMDSVSVFYIVSRAGSMLTRTAVATDGNPTIEYYEEGAMNLPAEIVAAAHGTRLAADGSGPSVH